jgi:hypothetical protein
MLSLRIEDRAQRAVRCWPIWRKETEGYLVAGLGHEVIVDGVMFDTAPIRNGAVFSILGISMTQDTIEKKLHDPTDHLSGKATMEFAWVKIGKQIFRQPLMLPYQRGVQHGYRKLTLNERITLELNVHSEDMDGAVLALLDPFTAAGIRIQVIYDLVSTVNLELADTHAGAAIADIQCIFPHFTAFSDHGVQLAIHADIKKLMDKIDVLGFTIDIDRLNLLNPEIALSRSPKIVDPESAASALAARYGQLA